MMKTQAAVLPLQGQQFRVEYERTKPYDIMWGTVRLMDKGKPVGPDLSEFMSNVGVFETEDGTIQGAHYPAWHYFTEALENLLATN